MMNLNSFAKEIHENAVAHGWWDEPRPFDELCALMISELAEALEEARAGRPMEYFWGSDYRMSTDGIYAIEGHRSGHKPEGIAVEMADCAIRILDYLGSMDWDIDEYLRMLEATPQLNPAEDVSVAFMNVTHEIVSARICVMRRPEDGFEKGHFTTALLHVLRWFKANDLDFEAIARRKHEYNKLRERLHGKLF